LFVMMVILLGSPAVWYFAGRLESAPIIGTGSWHNGLMAGGIGGGLAAVCWLWRTVRHRDDGLVPWQWITVGLLFVCAIYPHANIWPNARRRLPAPPMDSAEDVAMTVYAIIALVCSLLVGVIRVITAPGDPADPVVLKRTRTRPRPAPSKHKKRQRSR
jgi:hypothetical protein